MNNGNCHQAYSLVVIIRLLIANYLLTVARFRLLNVQALVHKGCGRTTTQSVDVRASNLWTYVN